MTTIEQDNQRLIATIYGEIDHHTAREIREEIDARILRVQPECLVLDFAHVTFMDSSGIGLIIGRYKLLSSVGAELYIRNMSEQIKKVVMLSGISRLAIISD